MAALRSSHITVQTDGDTLRRVIGSCLWLDLADFSKLTDRAMSQGSVGIETLSVTLGHLYATIGEIIEANSGELLFFAGDGALSCWVVDEGHSRRDAVYAASATALALRSALSQRTYGELRPSVRQIVLTGTWSLHLLGAGEGHALPLFTGRALNQLARLTTLCAKNHVLLSDRSARNLGPLAEVDSVARFAHSLRRLVERDRTPLETRGATSGVRASLGPWLVDERATTRALLATAAELRRVTILYVRIPSSGRAPLHALEDLTTDTQRAASREGGHLYQLVHDDKGIVYLLAFGLPGQSRGEDAVAALRCALQVADRAQLRGLSVSSGIATGIVYCGPCVDQQRRYYLLVGNAVIRAARLAGLDGRTPLVDDETFRATSRWFDFDEVGAWLFKGVNRRVVAHRIVRIRRGIVGPMRFVGREFDQAILRASVEAFAATSESRCLVIHGDIGAGKTALLSRLPLWAGGLGLVYFTHAADALDSREPYAGIRPLFQAVLGLQEAAGREEVEHLLDHLPGARELAALLNPLTPTQYSTSTRVELMIPIARHEQRLELVGELLARRLDGRSVVLVVDDTQWLDASSVELIQRLRRRLPRVLWVLSLRSGVPLTDPGDPFSDAEHHVLKPLADSDVASLVLASARAEHTEGRLLDVIRRAAQGNPLHTVELVRELLSSSRAVVAAGVLQLRPDTPADFLAVPPSLEELIRGRFDRLPPGDREVLRAASVFGTSFEVELVRRVLDPTNSPGGLEASLDQLIASGVVIRAEDYRFAHAAIQAVVYSLLPPSEQRTLHRRAAGALESAYADRLPSVAARLAYHLGAAQDFARAFQFSALAAEQALMGYAHGDAIRLYTQALDQAKAARGHATVDVQRALWSASLGQALYSEGRHAEARLAYERALAWTGCAEPGANLGALAKNVLGLAWEALRGRIIHQRPSAVPEAVQRRYRAAMHIMHASGPLDIWDGKLSSAANKAIAGYRLGAHVGVAREAAEAFADVGYMLAATPARERALSLLRRGVALADDTGDLEARTSTRVLMGMALTCAGRSAHATAHLNEADELALRLGSGLWRHRAAFMRAEALLFTGDLAGAALGFGAAARLAAAAEPPVEGLSNCLKSLAMARSGSIQEAATIASGTRGAALTLGHCMVLQRFASFGVCAELLARAELMTEALEAADRAIELAQPERLVSVFLAGLHGHAGVVACLLLALERARGDAASNVDARLLERRLLTAAQRLRRFGRLYVAAAPRVQLLLGHVEAQRGRPASARRLWAKAAAASRSAGQRHELGLALKALEDRKGRPNVSACI
jgi:class 3 adenylate cyclase/tetratricopeptide (TPR) repeat protein